MFLVFLKNTTPDNNKRNYVFFIAVPIKMFEKIERLFHFTIKIIDISGHKLLYNVEC